MTACWRWEFFCNSGSGGDLWKNKAGMLGTLAIAVIFALSMYYLAVSANNPFLYFNF